jgi:hypothetical protein
MMKISYVVQTPVIFQLLELPPEFQAARASLCLSLGEEVLDLGKLQIELIEKC